MMINAETIRNIVGVIGNVISFGMFISPVPTFFKIIRNKATDGFKPDPYLASVLNCLLWSCYGMPFVHPNALLVLTINALGLVLELVYVAIFFTYSKKDGRKKLVYWLAGEFLFFTVVVLIALFAFHGTKKRSLFVGILCDISNIIMYASPLTIMMKVIETKSVKYMPFFLSLFTFLNGSIWTAYALIKLDIFVLVSNGLGTISSACQLILYAFYCRSTPRDHDDDDDGEKISKPNEVQLSTSARAPTATA